MSQASEILNELKERLSEIYGDRLVRLVLFGSQARGDAEEGSDIDVMVVLKGLVSPCEEIHRTGEQVAKISLDRDVVVSCVFMAEDRFERERSPLLLNVRREGIPL
jgi:predicted nucleotidyltransferase